MTYEITNYTEGDWLDKLAYTDEWNIRALFALLAVVGPVKSFVDVGCGRGTLVELMYNILDPFDPSTTSIGFELFEPVLGHDGLVFVHDLREPLPSKDGVHLFGEHDLVVSWEVGEHLPEECADVYCDTLAALTGRWLCFTAAHPGQGGDHHMNEQPQGYWMKKLEDRGILLDQPRTSYLQQLWRSEIDKGVALTGPCFWLPENVMLFERPR